MTFIAETIWAADTPSSHTIEIRHTSQFSTKSAAVAFASESVECAFIDMSGLIFVKIIAEIEEVDPSCVVIKKLNRSPDTMGPRFITDPTTEEGRRRIEETFHDPRYSVTDDDYVVDDISLIDLARQHIITTPTGRLESLAYDVIEVQSDSM